MVSDSTATASKTEAKQPTESQLVAIVQDSSRGTGNRVKAFGDLLNGRKDLWDSLPGHVSKDRMKSLVLKTLRAEPKLLDCHPASVYVAISDAASLGLEIDGVLGHAYLIPYRTEAKLVPGYRGLLDLARRYGDVVISTVLVHEGDKFEFQMGDEPKIIHVPNQSGEALNDDASVTHVYLIAKKAGEVICRSVWSRAQVDQHMKKYSPSHNKSSSPWKTAWGTMARKTLIRDAIARGEIPVSAEAQRLAVREEHIESEMAVVDVRRGSTIDDIMPSLSHSNEPGHDDDHFEDADVVDAVDDHDDSDAVDVSFEPDAEPLPEPEPEPEKSGPVVSPKRNEKPDVFIQRVLKLARDGAINNPSAVSILKKQQREGFLNRDEVMIATERLGG